MSIIKKILFGRKILEPIFRRIFLVSMEGMNIGTGGNSKNNGEAHVLKWILKNESTPVVFDVGAQGGDYSMSVIGSTNGSAVIYAFEPRRKDYESLMSLLGERVNLFQVALGEYVGEGELFYPENVSGLSSFHKSDDKFSKSEKVKIDTVDNFCAKNNIKNITLLKLDVEGHELSCLRGSKVMLPNIKHIQFEFSVRSMDAKVYFRDIFGFLSDYKIYRIMKDGLVEVGESNKITEMLFTTNYLAIRR